MKLIRLVTDNKGVFTSSFESDMLIEPQSKMALLNLTFETNFENININPTNSQVTFKSDISDNDTEDTDAIAGGIYTQAQIQEYYDAVELGLNSALSLELSYTNSTPALAQLIDQNWVFSMFKILNFEGKKRIEYRYVPFLNPLVGGFLRDHFRKFYLPGDTPQGASLTIDTVGNTVTTIKALQTNSTTTKTRNTFAVTDRNMSVGNGIYMARCNDIRDNTSTLQDNGFAIGLSEIPIPQSALLTDLPDIYRANEIRVNRTGENYQYTINGAAELDSGVPAVNLNLSISTDVNDHDVMAFEMSDGNINFCVYQESLVGDYLNLSLGGDWTQGPVVATENYDEQDIDGSIAQYRRTQVGSPALDQWWEATSDTNWNVYNNKPLIGGTNPVDATAVADLTTGVISITGTTTTFTPQFAPPTMPTIPYTGVRNVFKQVAQKPGQKYYPYLYVNGGSANCIVDMVNITIDPYMFGNEQWDITGDNNESGRDNAYQNLLDSTTSVVRDAIPQVSDDQWAVGVPFTSRLTLYHEVWDTLGFSTNGSGTRNVSEDQDIGKDIDGVARWDADRLPLVKDSDNFLVVSDSLPLNSYDASTGGYSKESQKIGKRKNILMTIPVNDNNSGLVEYESNTPIFIDINNASAVNQKNLNFRLLRSDFSPIVSSDNERAVMTILIADKSE